MAVAPTLATVTPAICGFVRTGFAAAAGAATAEDEVAAAVELVEESDVVGVVWVTGVVGTIYRLTPPDDAFVVRVQSKQDVVDLGKEASDSVAVTIAVVIVVVIIVRVLNATLDALEMMDFESEFEENLMLLVGVALTPPVSDVMMVVVAVSVECVFDLAPRIFAHIP